MLCPVVAITCSPLILSGNEVWIPSNCDEISSIFLTTDVKISSEDVNLLFLNSTSVLLNCV